jgi:uncharacterized protein (TIGR02246 family)
VAAATTRKSGLVAAQWRQAREEYAMRSIHIAAAIAVLGLAVSASAQPVDQNTRQQIEQLVTTYRANWNNQNAAGIAGLYTKDGVLVSQAPKVVKTGTQEIVQQYETVFKTMSHNDGATAEVFPLGTDTVYSVGEYHLSGQNQSGPAKVDGHWTAVYVREGGAWKIKLLTAVPDLPPSAGGSAATPPATK